MSSIQKITPMPLSQASGGLSTAAMERLQSIEQMGERVSAYVKFMAGLGGLKGVSAEAKEKAVAVFQERLAVLERQLGRIQEDLELG